MSTRADGHAQLILARMLVVGLATTILAGAQATSGGAPAVKLGPVITVTATGSGNPEQAWAHADPSDPRYLMVCGYASDAADNLSFGYLYASSDGGTAWKRTLLENSTKFVSEESCTYAPSGTAYFVAGASNYYQGEPHHETGHMHLFASVDHGLTWTRSWTRRDGWLDWTSLADSPAKGGRADSVIIFGNSGTDKLGHWSPMRPVAVESLDGGRSFSNLIAPRPKGFRYVAVWTGDSVVLPNGTVLFATSAARGPVKVKVTGWAGAHVAVEIFAYDPSLHKLRSRAVLREVVKVPIFTASIAQDRSGGRFDGRLYAAWVEADAHASALWFAVSDDDGYRWRSRPILRGPGTDSIERCSSIRPVDQVRIAAAPNGTVGVLWEENLSTVFFDASPDGGATFGPPLPVADANAATYRPIEAITWDDYWLKTGLDLQAGKPSPQAAWVDTLGLGVVLYPSTIDDLSLAADRASRFHIFWIAPQGVAHRLMTRTAVVGKFTSIGSSLASTGTSGKCNAERASSLAHPALPQPRRAVEFQSGRDVTSSIGLDPIRYHYDSSANMVSLDVEIINKSKRILHAPMTIVGIEPHSDFGGAEALNASGSIEGQPYWDVSSVIPSAGLAHAAHSKPFHVAMKISRFHALPSNYFSGDAFSFAVRVYEGSGPVSSH